MPATGWSLFRWSPADSNSSRQDEPTQSAKARKLIESLTADEPGFVSVVAIVELVRVLESCFDVARVPVAQALDALSRTKQLVLDQAGHVSKALRAFPAPPIGDRRPAIVHARQQPNTPVRAMTSPLTAKSSPKESR